MSTTRITALALAMVIFASGAFGAEAQTAPPPAPEIAPVTIVQSPEAGPFYPTRAIRAGVEGRTTFRCIASLDGTLSDCSIVSEQPAGYDFGAATLKLVQQMRVTPEKINGVPVAGGILMKTVVWKIPVVAAPPAPPSEVPHSNIVQAPAGPYYPERAMRLGVEGRVTFRCAVNLDETLSDCSVVSEKPPGYGFGDAAMRLMPQFRVTPETVDGAPVAGGIFTYTIVWKLPH